MTEGQVPINPYSCSFSRVFQASVCIATYGMSVSSLHTESIASSLGFPAFSEAWGRGYRVYRVCDNNVLTNMHKYHVSQRYHHCCAISHTIAEGEIGGDNIYGYYLICTV